MFDDSCVYVDVIKCFCDEYNLVGLIVWCSWLLKVLCLNIDFGVILLVEDYGGLFVESVIIVM